jgi:N-acetylmuramic acid 6-phosphate (MurNAc-6-P) etherase
MGAPVDIIMTLPDGERIHLPGKVAYLGTGTSGDVGVRFDELPAYTQQQIQSYVDELAAGRTPKVRERTKSMPPGVLIKKKT